MKVFKWPNDKFGSTKKWYTYSTLDRHISSHWVTKQMAVDIYHTFFELCPVSSYIYIYMIWCMICFTKQTSGSQPEDLCDILKNTIWYEMIRYDLWYDIWYLLRCMVWCSHNFNEQRHCRLLIYQVSWGIHGVIWHLWDKLGVHVLLYTHTYIYIERESRMLWECTFFYCFFRNCNHIKA